MVGPRHLAGAVEFHALNCIDVGTHTAASEILTVTRPNLVAAPRHHIATSAWGPGCPSSTTTPTSG